MNANVISMTPKRIILDAKNGTSLEEAIKKYGYNSKEELRSAIYHFFPKDNKGREIWRKLTENSKKKVREKGRKDSNHIEMNGNGQNTGTDVLHDALGKNEPENVTLDKNSRKKALAHKEELLSKEVRDLEMRHKKICQVLMIK